MNTYYIIIMRMYTRHFIFELRISLSACLNRTASILGSFKWCCNSLNAIPTVFFFLPFIEEFLLKIINYYSVESNIYTYIGIVAIYNSNPIIISHINQCNCIFCICYSVCFYRMFYLINAYLYNQSYCSF